LISQKHIKDSERKFVNLMNEGKFFAQRVAGSGCGKYSVCDVVSVMGGQVFLTEVKSRSDDMLPLDKTTKSQIELTITKARENPPLRPLLVIHWKKRGWEMKHLDIEDVLSSSRIKFDERNLMWRFRR
jgi:Holliday junction resolvase